ncbi:phage tail tape measure protein [Carnobacterium sp.]|uniref:phage tail tape measure protein n=1 Tax=Carnobacterium sp. TaxID=48221 RepID=UPI00388E7B4B
MQIQAAGRAMKTMAGVAAGAGVALAGKTVVDSVKTYVEFEDAVTKAGSKFKDLDVTSAGYNDTLEVMQKAAREVGAVTKFSATDAAGALDKMAMAGLTSGQAMGMLMGTTNLAAAVGLDLTSAVDMATDAMGAFNLVSEDQNEISANMNRIADVVARTTNMANTDMTAWFEAVKSGAPQFTALGGDIETFSAAIGTLANAGIKGGEAGTALRNIMLRLSAPAKAGAEALSELGISVFDSEGKMLPFIDIMKQFETQLDGVADERKAKLLSDIFGSRAIGSFQVLMSAGTDELQRFTNELYNSAGAAETMAGAQMQSFSGMIEQLKSAYQDKQLSLAKAFEVGGAKEALAGLIAYVQNFDVTPFANLLTNIMQALPGIIEGIGNVFQLLWNMKDVIGALVIAWGVYKGALIAALVVEKVMGFVTAVQTMMAATQGMTAAQAALNVVMNANPIGLIVTAVAALGLGVYELIKHWDSVSAAMSVAWEWLQKIGSIIWDGLLGAFEKVKNFFIDFQPLLTLLLGPLGILINMIIEFKNNLNGIKEAFTDGGFVAGIRTIGATILSAILAPIQKVLELMVKIPFIGEKAQGGLDTISSIRQNSFGKQPVTLPVTQGERTAYSMSETINEDHVKIDVALEKGLNGTVSGSAPKTSLNLVNSGAW